VAALADPRCLLAGRGNVEPLEGFVEGVDPLGVNVQFQKLISVDH
jgi:hypothetical protein